MNWNKERLSMQSRQKNPDEIYTRYSFDVTRGCMVPLLPWNYHGEIDEAIITAHPTEGDVGVVHFLKNKKWFYRFGIWGPVEEKTGRRLILTLNAGENHGPIWGVTEDYAFDQMYVIGVLGPSDYQYVLRQLQHGT
jgi:hypothetical protein